MLILNFNLFCHTTKILDSAEDVEAFSKITLRMGFSVEYRDSEGNLRLYHPDFVMSTKGNGHLVVETKGFEDIDVRHKDERIRLWCKDATKLTNSPWAFKRVDQEDFERYRFKSIDELISTFKEDR